MMKRMAMLLLLALILLSQTSSAVSVMSGDNVIITHETGDVIVSGGRVTILAPVRGDVIAAGGDVIISAPISGDVIASGGRVEIFGDVGGKVIAAGGEVTINGAVRKFALLAGGEVNIGKDGEINSDVFAAGGQIKNSGVVRGNLTAIGGEYIREGKVMGHERFQKAEIFPSYIFEVIAAGFVILGLLLVYLVPFIFESSYTRMVGGVKDLVKTLIAGIIGIVASVVIGFILLFSIAGTSVGAFILTSAVLILLVSNLVVSYAIGKYLISGKTSNRYLYMVSGFVVLFMVTKVPYIGDLVLSISTCLGFGAIVFLLLETRREKMSGTVHEDI